MSNISMDYDALYEKAFWEFENGNYDIAVDLLIQLFNADYNKDSILDDLYNCFIIPNTPEFMDNYNNQIKNIMLPNIPYEELGLDFIPLSDTVYYIYNKKTASFCGLLDMNLYSNKTFSQKKFDSLLICNLWYPALFLDVYFETQWQKVYICLNIDDSSLFYSFFKIPGFLSVFDIDRTIFCPTQESYFQCLYNNSELYIPHTLYGKNTQTYNDINQKIHEYRIENCKVNHPFLTIAIPTYNRGEVALESVKQLLTLKYDSEIEILVSNNGSVQNTEGYKELAEIDDSRITYFEFEENQEYAGNIINVLTLGKGHFIMITSDEDRMFMPNLSAYLDFLYNNPDAGVIIPSGRGNNMSQYSQKFYFDTLTRYSLLFNQNYLTGLTYNSSILKANKSISQKVTDLVTAKNLFNCHYPHITYALFVCEHNYACLCDVLLWYSPEEKEDKNQPKVLNYMRPANRLEQQDSSIEIIVNELNVVSAEIKTQLIAERIAKTYYLLFLAFSLVSEPMSKEYDWLDTCINIWSHNNDLLSSYCTILNVQNVDCLLRINNALLQAYVSKDNPSEAFQTPEQIQSYQFRKAQLQNALNQETD